MFMNIQMQPQEEPSPRVTFGGPIYTTQGFQQKFGQNVVPIVLKTMCLIGQRVENGGADYLQVAQIDGETFWIIEDSPNASVTFLLPSEY
jgi:hypothetical protein